MKIKKIGFGRLLATPLIIVSLFSFGALTPPAAYAASAPTASNCGGKGQLPCCPTNNTYSSQPCTCPLSSVTDNHPDCLGFKADIGNNCANDINNPNACLQKNVFIQNDLMPIFNILSALVALVILANLVVGGIQYMTSTDKPESGAGAKKRITGSLTALLLYFLLYALVQFLVPGGIFK